MSVDKEEAREEILSDLLETAYDPKPKAGDLFVSSVGHYGDIHTHTNLAWAKFWKTKAGAENAFRRMKPDPGQKIKVVEITELWNADIDVRIENEIKMHEKRIESLLKKKI